MKCKYCDADIEQEAQFCPNCGKDLSKFNKCVKCGELLDNETVFCPHCGTEQPREKEVKRNSSKKWLLLFPLIALIVGAGTWCFYSDGFSDSSKTTAAEAVASDDERKAERQDESAENGKVFIESMYKDFFENKSFDTENISNLQKYLSPSVVERIKMECPYEGGEEDFSYVVDFFRDGSLSYERPDYGDKVVSRTIEPEDNDWFMVTNKWDVIEEPVKVRLRVNSVGGTYKVVDFSVDEDDEMSSIEDGISIEDAIIVAENMLIENGDYKGFRNPDDVNDIMQKKYGYKYEKRYFSEREWDFSPFYYKNCIFPQFAKDGDLNNYIGTPTARGEGISSFVGIDNTTCSVVISPFTKEVFNDYFNQIKRLGGTLSEEDDGVISYELKGYKITGFKNGMCDISYCIVIGKD